MTMSSIKHPGELALKFGTLQRYTDLSTFTVVPLHFSQKVYLYHQMKQ